MHMHMQHPMLRWCMHPKSLGDPETPEGRPRAAPCRAGFPESRFSRVQIVMCVRAVASLVYDHICGKNVCWGRRHAQTPLETPEC